MFNGNSTFSNGNSFGDYGSMDSGQSMFFLSRIAVNMEPFFWKYLKGFQDIM